MEWIVELLKGIENLSPAIILIIVLLTLSNGLCILAIKTLWSKLNDEEAILVIVKQMSINQERLVNVIDDESKANAGHRAKIDLFVIQQMSKDNK